MQNEFREKLLDPKRRAVIDAKFAIHNVGHKRWDIISKNIGDELELWTTLFEAGKNNFENYFFKYFNQQFNIMLFISECITIYKDKQPVY